MPRRPRLDLAGIAQHIVQRGNDRQPCFFQAGDYLRYLREMNEIVLKRGCQVHAYVLMTNHVHLLITPPQSGVIVRVMQSLGRRYVRYINDRYRRTGTLWEGRYKSSLIDSEDYLLRCYRYIELNPVRARMVADPLDYAWSSHPCNAFAKPDILIQPHPSYTALGAHPASRCRAYRQLVMEAIDPAETHAIRLHLQRGYALGPKRFQQAIETQLKRKAGPARIGRPPKS